jgi:hypothetical protein
VLPLAMHLLFSALCVIVFDVKATIDTLKAHEKYAEYAKYTKYAPFIWREDKNTNTKIVRFFICLHHAKSEDEKALLNILKAN